ncbi:hypothetical protein [Halalkalibacter alkaliphilus]|uniref:Uncharacterized protein n=1 Tax=Halalkalibacter alkaliphilus TaxID=2917993 RepID=A0A9X2CTL2_9BACI|nr:hypothetical protein [Halalkalibacter alkaliphilus]MCL7748091.1 hypothetical protein [Halalkalibacter alkaliphilus]
MRRRNWRFHHHHHHHHKSPRWWLKVKAIFAQILVPLICFQLLRTLILPTTFDMILLTIMVVTYFSITLRLI